MKKLIVSLFLAGAYSVHGAAVYTVIAPSQFPNTNNPGTNWLMIVVKPGVTNYNINMLQLQAYFNANLGISNAVMSVEWTNAVNPSIKSNTIFIPSNSPSASVANHLTREYNLKDYGAFGDAKFAAGAMAMTNTTAMTVTYGKFTSDDVGSYIGVYGADTNRRTFWTTIASVNSGNQIVLADTPRMAFDCPMSGNVLTFDKGTYVVYGKHDDSAAIQTWLNQYTNGGGDFYAPHGIYLVMNPPQNTNQNNAQIIVPNWTRYQNNTNQWYNAPPILNMYGDAAYAPGYASSAGLFNPPQNSTWFVSNLQGNNWTGTNLFGASFIDFRDYDFPSGHFYGHNNRYYWPSSLVHPIFENVNIMMGYDCNAVALNLIGAYESEANRLNVAGGILYPSYCPPPLGTNGWGIVMPGNYNGAGGDFRNVTIYNFMNGLDMGIIKGDYITFFACSNALTSQFSGGATEARINNIQFVDCPIWYIASGLNFDGTGGSPAYGTKPILNVLDYQGTVNQIGVPDWQTNIFAIYDPSNQSLGGVVYYPPGSGTAATPQTFQTPDHRFFVNPIHAGLGFTNVENEPVWLLNPNNRLVGTIDIPQFLTVGYTITNIPNFASLNEAWAYASVGHGNQSQSQWGIYNSIQWLVGVDRTVSSINQPDYSFEPVGVGVPYALTLTTNALVDVYSNLVVHGKVILAGGISTTNTPSNGDALRYTNGNYYWAP